MTKIGIIGGSGLENPDILSDAKEETLTTKFGSPSSPIITGKIAGVDVAIISRHGRKHQIKPSDVPFRANIQAFKDIGCTHIIATTACGSLDERIEPGDFVFADQFVDMTKKREYTLFAEGVCHIPMDTPFCPHLRDIFSKAAVKSLLKYHKAGTVITIEGPRFSSRAESRLWRQWGCDIINMSTVPEVVLAREAGICYAIIAMATDYDSFLEGRAVNVDEVMTTFHRNVENVKKLILEAIPMARVEECRCRTDVKSAFMG